MFVRTLRFLKLPIRGNPYPRPSWSSRSKIKAIKENGAEGPKMELMDKKDVPEPSNLVEEMATTNNVQNSTTDESAGALAIVKVEPLERNDTDTYPNDDTAERRQFTKQEIEALWHETLDALIEMLNVGEVHPSYRELLLAEKAAIENKTNSSPTCYERWRDQVVKKTDSDSE